MSLNAETLHEQRPYLLRLAVMQLGDKHQAEDVAQETLLAALEGLERFRGEASPRTFLVSILKRKIADRFRAKSKVDFAELGDDDEFDISVFDVLFKANDHWAPDGRPTAWPSAEQALSDTQFWAVLEACMTALPRKTAMVFVHREVLGEEIADICKNLEVTTTICSVMLYRARMSLRECLERRWLC